MSQPAINTAGQALYDHLEPLVEQDETYNWATLFLISAIGAMAQSVNDIVEDAPGRVGWSLLFDPYTCLTPWLPWLAWLYGVTLTPGLTEQQQRDTIHELPPHKAGTPDALISAVRITLDPTVPLDRRVVRLIERDGSAYHHTVRTYQAQTPDPAASEKAALSQIPIDSTMTFETVIGWTWAEAMAHYSGTTTSWHDVMTAAGDPDWVTFAHEPA